MKWLGGEGGAHREKQIKNLINFTFSCSGARTRGPFGVATAAFSTE
jgi:hypothetical protein